VASATRSRAERSTRRYLPLRWRLVLLVTLAIALLSVAAVLTSYLAVRSSLLNDLRGSLREDALRVAALYGSGEPGRANENLTGPTGGVTINLYDAAGNFLATSATRGPDYSGLIPAETVQAATAGLLDWQTQSEGRQLLVALAPFGVGVAAVISETGFISSTLSQIAQVLTLLGVALVLIGAVVAWFIADRVMQPLRWLARRASALGPDNLQEIEHNFSRDELGLLSATLNRLIGRLRSALDGQRQFLLETSHELRTPLTSLQGFLDRALRRGGAEVQPELQNARRIASNMTRLVEDLLQLTRGESVVELEPHLVDPYLDVLSQVAEEFPGVNVRGEAGALLIGDPGRLRQLVRNLTANAVRAAGAEAVQLELELKYDCARITVRDHGPGIAPEEQQHIFDKFWRGTGGGAGLGLAIARQIAVQHGGTIELRSEPGLTEFTVSLPLPVTDEASAAD